MVGGVREILRRQSKVPLETISASGLAAVLSFLHMDTEPFELCGVVYARPPREVYIIVGFLSAVTCLFSVLFALGRCYAVCRRGDHETRIAHLVPCEGAYRSGNLIALYLRGWWVPTLFGLFFVIPGLVLWFSATKLPPIYPALGCIIGFRALNMLLSILMIILPSKKNSIIDRFINILSVFFTDKEYDAPDFENELCLSEEVSCAPSSHVAEIANYPHAIITLDSGTSLSIRSDRDVGVLGAYDSWITWFSITPVRMPMSKLVRIEKKYLNFRLIPVRVPFSIMWYSVYQGFEIVGAYGGAQDIEKCLIWLALVSILTELIVNLVSGPCVVIKTRNCDESESPFIT